MHCSLQQSLYSVPFALSDILLILVCTQQTEIAFLTVLESVSCTVNDNERLHLASTLNNCFVAGLCAYVKPFGPRLEAFGKPEAEISHMQHKTSHGVGICFQRFVRGHLAQKWCQASASLRR